MYVNLVSGLLPERQYKRLIKQYDDEQAELKMKIDTSACNMAEYLIKEMAKKQGVTEELKATDMMRWMGLSSKMCNFF